MTTQRSREYEERRKQWLQILDMVQAGTFHLVRSPAHDFTVAASHAVTDRARALAALGFGPLDALHLAFAEASAARWFVTTDDRLLKVAMGHREQLRVEVVMPDQVPLETGGDHV